MDCATVNFKKSLTFLAGEGIMISKNLEISSNQHWMKASVS